ncbi:MAG TPA: type II toxin-antitoxin system ParD family antitoxin [Pararhizobium sp.]|jgi:antitoxin ParD1/3/4|uniref:type II toxin-antitoxin system ParD family antitoxin n=1 Tax=Rhizobium/Agrobacterium group TaxID=227290 RepID=UPI0006F4E883|nr:MULTISPECIES: type II toxin-antitoxin system ParD family antitoxin [Rhizobium/Agrobacterium group]KQY27108.1 CopG family transcriptional regulator [Rhizobium sp. Root482]HTO32584.1 type II toxin-antitoxin system ParD family antitoxin [Pararhizobium sp.]
MRTGKSITVTLGEQQALLDARLQAGTYEDASQVVRAGLRALDREETAVNKTMRAKIHEAISDPHPDIPAAEVFARLRSIHLESR